MHFTRAGYDLLAGRVADSIAAMLEKSGKVDPKGTIRLWQGDAPFAKGRSEKDVPELTVYPAKAPNSSGAGMVICPGGGYGFLAMGHEGKAVAEWLNSIGVTAFVLKYRHAGGGYAYPVPMTDAKRAMRLVRARSGIYGLAPDRIGIIGFSAGWHLASFVGTHCDGGDPKSPSVIERVSCRPDFMVLGYPVITMSEGFMHRGSRDRLIGKEPSAALAEETSNEKRVTGGTPPTFLVHADDDRGVSPLNSIAFYMALRKVQVPAEMHIFLKGGHGFAFRPLHTETDEWPRLCAAWIKQMGFID